MVRGRPDLSDYDFNRAPFIAIWEVTRACKLVCKHCRAEAQPEADPCQLSHEEGLRLIDGVAAFGEPLPNLVFTGGDPLMRPDLFDLIRHAVSRGLRVSMTPSATPLVTREAMRRAKEAGLARWAFSIDGSTAEIHDAFRGVQGSYDLTIKAIEYLHELGLPIQINSTVSRYNLDDLDNLAALVERLGAVMWSVFFLVPTGRGQLGDMISPQEHERVFNWLYDVSLRVPFDIKTTAAQHYRRVVLQRRSAEKGKGDGGEAAPAAPGRPLIGAHPGRDAGKDGIGRAPKGVNDGNGFVFISHTGDVYPSGFLPVAVGNVRERPLVEIYRDSPMFRALRDPDGYRGKCSWCEFRYICGGSRARAYAVTGDYLESEPFCVHIPDPRRGRYRSPLAGEPSAVAADSADGPFSPVYKT